MTFRLSTHTAPTAEPISLTEAKLHLRLAADAAGAALYTTEDAQLAMWISSARHEAETKTWRPLVLQVFDLFLDAWPTGNEIHIPMPPLLAVESITYTDSAGTQSTFSADDYTVDTDSFNGRVVLGYEKTWPSVTLAPDRPIKIRFRAGFLVPFSADSSTGVVSAINHPYADGDKVRLHVSGGSLPDGLDVRTDYYVRDAVADVSFKLAATVDGDAITLTDNGSGSLFIGEIPENIIAAMLLIIGDRHATRNDTHVGLYAPVSIPKGAEHLLYMSSARAF